MTEQDHQGMAESYQRGFALDYLERIAIALEKIAENTEKPNLNQQITYTGPSEPPGPPSAAAGGYVTSTLCGDDDPDIREKSGPCIRQKHHGKPPFGTGDGHRDKNGGEW